MYFVTVCTRNQEHLFGEIVAGKMIMRKCGQTVELVWRGLPKRFPDVELDQYSIMPNHFHGIIVIKDGVRDELNVRAIHESPVHTIHESPVHTIANSVPQSNNPSSVRIERRRMLLPKVIGYFKMNTAKRINQLRNTPATPVWHRSYYDHVIRNDADLNRIRQYVLDNPLQWDIDPENVQGHGSSHSR